MDGSRVFNCQPRKLSGQESQRGIGATIDELTTRNAKIAKKNAYDFALHDFAFPLCVLCVLCG